MSSTNYMSKTCIVMGMAVLAMLPLSVRAFRALNTAGGQQANSGCKVKSVLRAAAASSVTGGKDPDLAGMRVNYVTSGIDEKVLPSKPHELMSKWIEDACNCKEVIEPNAMCLSTVGRNGRPSARYVLMKKYSEEGVTWYTNYNSRKAQELDKVPHAAITFWWGALHRSIRLEGEVQRVSKEESDEYYACRPTGSKIGAWVSDQSDPIGSRTELDQKAKKVEEAFAPDGEDVPRPPHWGGFRLRPSRVEFWEGQPSRLHDRIVYTSGSEGPEGEAAAGERWTITRLQP